MSYHAFPFSRRSNSLGMTHLLIQFDHSQSATHCHQVHNMWKWTLSYYRLNSLFWRSSVCCSCGEIEQNTAARFLPILHKPEWAKIELHLYFTKTKRPILVCQPRLCRQHCRFSFCRYNGWFLTKWETTPNNNPMRALVWDNCFHLLEIRINCKMSRKAWRGKWLLPIPQDVTRTLFHPVLPCQVFIIIIHLI